MAAIDPKAPIVAICGKDTYPAQFIELCHNLESERSTCIVLVGVPHKLRVDDNPHLGGEVYPPGCWNFYLDDGTWNGEADIRIENRK